MILLYLYIMKKSTTILDFFKIKGSTSNSSEVNMELPTTNVAIPILENVDVPILENVNVSILENVDVPISQTQFQRIDLDSLDYDPEHANKYGNIMLINVMKFDRLILKRVCTNLPKKFFFSAYFWPPQA